uniref:Uncharacterized protein n=1 Tax=Arundo donax TaxID=35708 RepID=A0A0A9DXB0_ARUDO
MAEVVGVGEEEEGKRRHVLHVALPTLKRRPPGEYWIWGWPEMPGSRLQMKLSAFSRNDWKNSSFPISTSLEMRTLMPACLLSQPNSLMASLAPSATSLRLM